MSHTFRTTDEVLQLVAGREVLDAPSYKKLWTASRLIRLDDGSTLPLLWIIAEAKFGPFDPKTHMPFWKDKLCTNESFENVELLEISSEHRTRQNPYGVPAGTREYMKRYRAANKEKVKGYHKKYYDKMREAYQAQRTVVEGPKTSTALLMERLLEIIPEAATDPDPSKDPS